MKRNRFFVLIAALAFNTMSASAYADDTDCPLHARIEAQKALSSQAQMPVSTAMPEPTAMPISDRSVGSSSPPFDQGNRQTPEIDRSIAPAMAEPSRTDPVPPMTAAVDPPFSVVQIVIPSENPIMTSRDNYVQVLKTRLRSDADGLARFDYAGAKQDGDLEAIKLFINEEAFKDANALSPAQATVYWANLYNAITLQVVLENYPVRSIMRIKSGIRPGPWKRKLVTIGGKDLSLDNIEHDILREKYPSPYIHYMVNCASIGCPNLKAGLWQVETLDADQKAAARAYINSSRGAVISDEGLTLSKIYKWFKKDFGGKSGVLNHIRQYADEDLAAAIDKGVKARDYDYDWSLNE